MPSKYHCYYLVTPSIPRTLLDEIKEKGINIEVRLVPNPNLNTGVPIKVFDGKLITVRYKDEIIGTFKTDKEAKKFLDDINNNSSKLDELDKPRRLKMATQLWDDFSYDDLLKTPPAKKPCFLAGTLVATGKGKIAIEDITINTLVYSYNFNENKKELQPVLELYRNTTEKYIAIETTNTVIKVTGAHRFWLVKEKIWKPASKLVIRDVFKSITNGATEILNLTTIDAVKNTFNLEVQSNSNYYVGEEGILSHNMSKVSKFASTDLIDVEFYEIIGRNTKKGIYVGQTIQGIGKRFDQHKRDPKKHHWKNEMRGVLDIEIGNNIGPFKMTPYEAAVTELYEINNSGGRQKDGGPLFNKQRPIGKKKFIKFKNDKSLGFNPCKFYV